MKNTLAIILLVILSSCVTLTKQQQDNREAAINFLRGYKISVAFKDMEWGGLAHYYSEHIKLSYKTLSYTKNIMWSVIIHEAAHIILYRQGKQKAIIKGYKAFVEREQQTDRYAKKLMLKRFPTMKYWGYYINASPEKLCDTYRKWLEDEEAECQKE